MTSATNAIVPKMVIGSGQLVADGSWPVAHGCLDFPETRDLTAVLYIATVTEVSVLVTLR
jgi:hypothetical protein